MSISCFLIVKNCLKQGYPFIESIASALPLCEEFLISDGFSTDGTYEILLKIQSLNKKINVFQEGWSKKDLSILADISNKLKKKCRSKYLFYIQAAEVVHEKNYKFIRALPELYPETETFCLPYITVVGNYKIADEARLRFCRNLQRFVAIGDAWALSVSKNFVRAEAKRNLKHPKSFLNLIGRGVEWRFAGSMNNQLSRVAFLPKAIVRYPALFKNDYIERCRGHANLFNLTEFHNSINSLEEVGEEEFIQKFVEQSWSKPAKYYTHYFGEFGVIRLDDHPRIMHGLLSSKEKSYYVRDNVLDIIADS